jgi:hypothetical protein
VKPLAFVDGPSGDGPEGTAPVERERVVAHIRQDLGEGGGELVSELGCADSEIGELLDLCHDVPSVGRWIDHLDGRAFG